MEAGMQIRVTDINSPFYGWMGLIRYEINCRDTQTPHMRANHYYVADVYSPIVPRVVLNLAFNENQLEEFH